MAGRWSNKYFPRTTEAEYKSRKYQLKKKKKRHYNRLISVKTPYTVPTCSSVNIASLTGK